MMSFGLFTIKPSACQCRVISYRLECHAGTRKNSALKFTQYSTCISFDGRFTIKVFLAELRRQRMRIPSFYKKFPGFVHSAPHRGVGVIIDRCEMNLRGSFFHARPKVTCNIFAHGHPPVILVTALNTRGIRFLFPKRLNVHLLSLTTTAPEGLLFLRSDKACQFSCQDI
jgi:hypothetical protein